MRSEYLINYENATITDIDIDSLIIEIKSILGIPLKDLKVSDLVFYDNEDIKSGNGVYIFKSEEKIYYVGNCYARNFVERIPAHFDIRHNGWFNSLLKAIIKDKYGKVKLTPENEYLLSESAKFAFENLSLIIINFKIWNKDNINKLESVLGKTLKPINNRFRKIV